MTIWFSGSNDAYDALGRSARASRRRIERRRDKAFEALRAEVARREQAGRPPLTLQAAARFLRKTGHGGLRLARAAVRVGGFVLPDRKGGQ